MREKSLFLLISCLLVISIMTGGCTSMENQMVTTNTTNEQYPNKPITILVPFSAGSGSDLVARLLEKSALEYSNQSIIVANKPGGGGALCWNELANSKPDGYTIGTSSSALLLQPIFDPTKYYLLALEPLAQITDTPFVIAVQANQSWQSIDDLINYAKRHPKQLKFGHSGIGSISHILGEVFCKKTEISMEQVPFQGPTEQIAALLGGHIQVTFISPEAAKEHVKNGTIKVLAVSSKKRLTDPDFVDVQTLKELGLDIVYSTKLGVVVPKEIPLNVKNKLAEELSIIITTPEFKKGIENTGLQYEYLGPEDSENEWIAENQKLSKEVQETGILESILSQKQ